MGHSKGMYVELNADNLKETNVYVKLNVYPDGTGASLSNDTQMYKPFYYLLNVKVNSLGQFYLGPH